MQIILQRYANREYRLTQQNIAVRPKDGGDKYADKQLTKYSEAIMATEVFRQNMEVGATAEQINGRFNIESFSKQDAIRAIRALDIIDEFRQIAKTRKNKGGWGFAAKPTSFTRNARHRLLEAGAVIDNEFGKNCYEVTLTLPGSGKAAYQTLANWTGWICDRLLREVRRNTITSHWFYVWEWQKRGALHLHFAIAGSDMTEVKKVAQGLEYMWFELLLELEQKTGVELFRKNRNITWRNKPEKWQSHVFPIRKSVAAYFSKYAGKSTNTQPKHGCAFYPARWWGSSRAIKQGIELRRHRYEFSGSNADMKQIHSYLREWLDDPSKIKTYSYDFDLGKTNNGTTLGSGHVEVSYYHDEGFIRMQAWEPYVIEHCYSLGEHDADMGSMAYADIPPMLRRHYKCIADMGKMPTPPHPPHNQPSYTVSSEILQGVRRRTPTLAIRAKLLQYLAEGDGDSMIAEREAVTEYIQGELSLF